MACMMTIHTARRISTTLQPKYLLDPPPCLYRNTNSKSVVLQVDYEEYNPLINSHTVYNYNGVPIRFFPISGYIVAYSKSYHSGKRALLAFLKDYPLNTEKIDHKFDYLILNSQYSEPSFA